MLETFLQIDLPALLTLLFCPISCALTGSLLLLRKESLLCDALSHVVLPGIVGGFILAGSMSFLYIISGAFLSSMIAIALIYLLIHRLGIDPGSAMAITFTSLFALGVLMLELGVASDIHLDAQHAFFGALELQYWADTSDIASMPHTIFWLAGILCLITCLITLGFAPLRTLLFDETFAMLGGIPTKIINLSILALSALICVLSFQAAGSILVIALFICPAITARMVTRSLKSQLILSSIFAILSVILGYSAANYIPPLLGMDFSLHSAGMVALTAGFIQTVTMIGSLSNPEPSSPAHSAYQ